MASLNTELGDAVAEVLARRPTTPCAPRPAPSGCEDPRLPVGMALGAAIVGLAWALLPDSYIPAAFTLLVVASCGTMVFRATVR